MQPTQRDRLNDWKWGITFDYPINEGTNIAVEAALPQDSVSDTDLTEDETQG